MMENGKMEEKMAEVVSILLVEIHMKENGKTIRNMVKVIINHC